MFPGSLYGNERLGSAPPLTIWHDVAVLVLGIAWEETGDDGFLLCQYKTITTWLHKIRRNKSGPVHLWDFESQQLDTRAAAIFLDNIPASPVLQDSARLKPPAY